MTTARLLNPKIVAVAGLAMLLVGGQAFAQPTYSVDVQGPTFGSGTITGSDILTPIGPGTVPPPAVAVPGFAIGVFPTSVGFDELDALSYGKDPLIRNQPNLLYDWSFSVDEFAVGQPSVPAPSVSSEGAFGAGEASADIYSSVTPAGPLPIFFGGNTGLFDGNGGATPFLAPGLNLVEPNPPTPFTFADPGDNLDAWDIDSPPPAPQLGTVFTTPIYYSLDSHFPDPLEVVPPYNTGTALSNGFVGGDVLISTIAGVAPTVYASAASLGLDFAGTDTDDLDALVLWDNGDGIYQPTNGPYSWAVAGGTDMLLFSVRRGSALIGTIDAILGVPIEEGDILVPFAFSTPGIFVPAEAIGLATLRTNGAVGTFQGFGDDLDGLDVIERVVPEPTTLALAGMGLAGVLWRRRR